MIWVIAVLVILVLGVIAAVAGGWGDPMAEVYDDRPDVTLPAEGPVTSETLRTVRFTSAVRGYRASEVDALLQRLADQLEAPRDGAPGDEGHS